METCSAWGNKRLPGEVAIEMVLRKGGIFPVPKEWRGKTSRDRKLHFLLFFCQTQLSPIHLKMLGYWLICFLPEAMQICKGQHWLIGSQVLSHQEKCGIDNIFLRLPKHMLPPCSVSPAPPPAWRQPDLHISLPCFCLGNLGFSRCFCFSDTLFHELLFLSIPAHALLDFGRCPSLAVLPARGGWALLCKSCTSPTMFGEPVDPFCLCGGKLFSNGGVNDSEVTVWSLALEQPVLGNGIDPGMQWTQLPAELGIFYLFSDTCGFDARACLQTVSHIHNHYGLKSMISFGARLTSAGAEVRNYVV